MSPDGKSLDGRIDDRRVGLASCVLGFSRAIHFRHQQSGRRFRGPAAGEGFAQTVGARFYFSRRRSAGPTFDVARFVSEPYDATRIRFCDDGRRQVIYKTAALRLSRPGGARPAPARRGLPAAPLGARATKATERGPRGGGSRYAPTTARTRRAVFRRGGDLPATTGFRRDSGFAQPSVPSCRGQPGWAGVVVVPAGAAPFTLYPERYEPGAWPGRGGPRLIVGRPFATVIILTARHGASVVRTRARRLGGGDCRACAAGGGGDEVAAGCEPAFNTWRAHSFGARRGACRIPTHAAGTCGGRLHESRRGHGLRGYLVKKRKTLTRPEYSNSTRPARALTLTSSATRNGRARAHPRSLLDMAP